MKIERPIKDNNGFTLIETIVATGLIVVGLVAALALITSSLSYVSDIQNRLVAANLAAEGIEVVRNIRDNNWIQNRAWNYGISTGVFQTYYNSTALTTLVGSGDPLKLDANGFYNYEPFGVTTLYTRKIYITNGPTADLSTNEMRVISTVTWQKKGATYTSSAEDHLFNWK